MRQLTRAEFDALSYRLNGFETRQTDFEADAASIGATSGTLNAAIQNLSGTVDGAFQSLSGTIDARFNSLDDVVIPDDLVLSGSLTGNLDIVVARNISAGGSITGSWVGSNTDFYVNGNPLSGTINARFAAVGTGTLNTIAKWSNPGQLGDSIITETGGIISIDGGSNEVILSINNTGTGGRTYQVLSANDASGLNPIKFSIYDPDTVGTILSADSGGNLTVHKNLSATGNVNLGDSVSDSHVIAGQTLIGGGTWPSIFQYNGASNGNTYIRAGETPGLIYIGDVNTGGVNIGQASNKTTVAGQLQVETEAIVVGTGATINNGGYIVHVGDVGSGVDTIRQMIGFSHGASYTDGNVRAGIGSIVETGGQGFLVFETGPNGTAQAERMRITPAAVSITNNLIVSGNSNLGNSTADTHTVNGTVIHSAPASGEPYRINKTSTGGSGRNTILKLHDAGFTTAGDMATIHFNPGNTNDVYNAWIGAKITGTSPAFLNPKLVFGIQDADTTGTGNVTERFEVTNTGVGVAGNVLVQDDGHPNGSLYVTVTPSAATAAKQAIHGSMVGTYDTTAGTITATGINGNAQSTKSAGGNLLVNVGLYGFASGGDINRGLWVNGGDALVDYNLIALGNATLGSANTNAHALVGTSQLQSDTTASSWTALGLNRTAAASVGYETKIAMGPAGAGANLWSTCLNAGDLSGDFSIGTRWWDGATYSHTDFNINAGITSLYKNVGPDFGSATPNLRLYDNTTQAVGVGGAVDFLGNFTGTTPTTAASIKAFKENSTAGQWGFGLGFATRLDGSSFVTEHMRIRSDGTVDIKQALRVSGSIVTSGSLGVGTTSPVALFEVHGGQDTPIFRIGNVSGYAELSSNGGGTFLSTTVWPIHLTVGGVNRLTLNTNGTASFSADTTIWDVSARSVTGSQIRSETDFYVAGRPLSGTINAKFVDIAPGRFLGQQIKTSGGTYTPTAGTNTIIVKMAGGGGGGGGGAGNASVGGGGSAGAFFQKKFTVTSATGSISIGAAGAGGSTGGGSGGTGGDTSFSINLVTYLTKGGLGGGGMAATATNLHTGGGARQAGSTAGDINFQDPGIPAFFIGGSFGISGKGGGTPFGNGGWQRTTASPGTGDAGLGYGAAGAGAATVSGGTAGGAGIIGVVIIEEYT